MLVPSFIARDDYFAVFSSLLLSLSIRMSCHSLLRGCGVAEFGTRRVRTFPSRNTNTHRIVFSVYFPILFYNQAPLFVSIIHFSVSLDTVYLHFFHSFGLFTWREKRYDVIEYKYFLKKGL
jgi:hypothetical protein